MGLVQRTTLVLILLLAAGCSGESDSSEGTKAKASTPPAAAEGGTPGITLDLPKGWTPYPQSDRTDFWAGAGKHFRLFAAPPGTTEQDALAAVPSTVEPVVKHFQVESEEDAEVAGAPARHLFGKGIEADDGDDAVVAVYVFTAGGRVRVVCIPGEGHAAEMLRPDVLAILATVKAE